jgi:hypothetical protein
MDMLGTPFDRYYAAQISLIFTMLSYAGFTSTTQRVFIGIERLIAIMWPLHQPRIVTEKTLAMAVLTAWLIPAVSIVPGLLYVMETIKTDQDQLRLRDYHYTLCVVAFCTFTIALSGIHAKIYHDARAQVNKVQAMTQVNHRKDMNIKGNNKAIKMVLMILLAFLASGFLYVIHGALKLCGVDPDGVNPAVILLEAVSFVLIQSNAAVNFAVYAAFSLQFRRGYGFVLCCCKQTRHSSTSITERMS